jgi:hypothetical protein
MDQGPNHIGVLCDASPRDTRGAKVISFSDGDSSQCLHQLLKKNMPPE